MASRSSKGNGGSVVLRTRGKTSRLVDGKSGTGKHVSMNAIGSPKSSTGKHPIPNKNKVVSKKAEGESPTS
jgi:hypothetical protein